MPTKAPKAKPPRVQARSKSACLAVKAARNGVLDRAIDVLETRGWTQHDLRNAAGEFCLIGAIQEAQGSGPDSFGPANAAVTAVARYLSRARKFSLREAKGHDNDEESYGFTHGNVYEWNDRDKTTKTKVIAALRKAKTMPMVVAKESP